MRAMELREWGILVLRIVIGASFMAHGGQKLFVIGAAGSAAIMTRAGIPFPGIAGPFVGVVEFFGGLALVLGLLSRWAALLLICDMIVAILTVNIHRGFLGPGGSELPVIMLAANVALAAYGPGILSLQSLFRRTPTPASEETTPLRSSRRMSA